MTDQNCIDLEKERILRPNLVKVAEYLATCNAGTQAAFLNVITAFPTSGGLRFADVPVGGLTEACKASEGRRPS